MNCLAFFPHFFFSYNLEVADGTSSSSIECVCVCVPFVTMKELSTYIKIAISLAVAYSFYPHDSSRQLPAFVSSPLTQLQQWFFETIRPRMERNVIAVPEAFMTTVTFDKNKQII